MTSQTGPTGPTRQPDRPFPPRVYPLDPAALTQEQIAVTFAMTSRRPEPFDEIARQVSQENAADFHDRWVVGYGHASVAEHAVVHLAVENFSRIAVDELEDNRLASYTEKSSRYQLIDQDAFHIPAELDANPELRRSYIEAARALFAGYAEITQDLVRHLEHTDQVQAGERPGQRRSRLRRQATDASRSLLPAATLTNVGLTANEPVEQFVGKSQPKPAGNSPQDGEEHPEYPEQEAYQDDEEEEEDEPTAGQQATASAKLEVAKHLYDKMRGSCNLVFAGSRQDVEWYADALRKLSERDRAPLEFFPHHSNLSQSHRRQLERNLKAGEPTTAVCTSTLELGIDIGDINTVAQIGPPYSVASLRHRLGRSGRRPGQPAILRMYNVEEETNAESHPIDRLHLRTLRSMANLELLVEGWCEPPSPQAMHLSTLVHQIMSVIAERSSSNAKELHQILCREGPFQSVGPQTFISLLRHLGQEDNSIIQQEPDNQLILGPLGERIVNHYTFYAVFQTPEEYRVVNNGQTIGSMPNNGHLVPKQRIILAGKPWRIIEVQHRERIIEVRSTRSGKTTHFGNSNGIIHDRIIARTKQILNQEDFPNYLDQGACQLLQKARTEFRSLKLHQRSICPYDQENILIAPWTGTVKTNTLTSLLQAMGHQAHAEDGLIQVEKKDDLDPIESLKEIAEMKPEQVKDLLFRVAEAASAPYTEKYHPYLSPELRFLDTLSSKLSPADAPKIAQALLNGAEAPPTDLE